MNPETPDCSVTSMAKARIPFGMFATSPGGVPLGPSFFSITTSPSSSVVLTQRSSTSFGAENAPTGIADFAIRITLTASGLRISSSLRSRAATRTSWASSTLAGSWASIWRVRSIAIRPKPTASPSIISDLPFMTVISPVAIRMASCNRVSGDGALLQQTVARSTDPSAQSSGSLSTLAALPRTFQARAPAHPRYAIVPTAIGMP